MNSHQSHLTKNVGVFLAQNKERYEIISGFQDLLNNINKESYAKTIKYIKLNNETFFNTRESAILFLFNINYFTIFNYKQMELILDILCEFSAELKRIGIDEIDIIDMNKHLLCDINYLFQKKVISIQSIIQKSVYLEQLFINFWPEIDEFDHEYAMLREESLFTYNTDPDYVEDMKSLYKSIKANPKQHILNRNKNYNPSALHKAIRDDDLTLFKSILAKEKRDVNYKFDYSFYERTLTFDKKTSIIQVAAVYGSLKVFQYLWNQKNIVLDKNLLCYAYSGRNREIIHTCEKKCSEDHILYYAIYSHQKDLVDNLMKSSTYQPKKKDIPNFVDDNENIYKKLTRENLMAVVRSGSAKIHLSCLNKILYIMEKVEDNTSKPSFSNCDTFLQNCFYDLELFKFLYSNKSSKYDFFKGDPPKYLLAIDNAAFDVVKFLIKIEKPQNILTIFRDSLKLNSRIANYILDLQIKEKSSKSKSSHSSLFDLFKSQLNMNDLALAIQYYNEDIIVKMNQLYGIIDKNLKMFVSILTKFASSSMMNSLFNKNLAYTSNVNANFIAGILHQSGFEESAKHIYSIIPDYK